MGEVILQDVPFGGEETEVKNPMIRYAFYYEDILLGFLHIRDGLYCYIPEAEGVKKVWDHVPLTREMLDGRDWGKPIPFFQERIENAQRFGIEKCIRYHTDLFVMRML